MLKPHKIWFQRGCTSTCSGCSVAVWLWVQCGCSVSTEYSVGAVRVGAVDAAGVVTSVL